MKKHPIIVSIPHASIFVPKDIKENMIIGERDVRNHADLYTDEIYNIKNAHVLNAKISRLIVDVNRAPDDIETECRLQVDGVVVRTTSDGKIIYKFPPSVKAICSRIEKHHDTFHDELGKKIEETGAKFLIDGHSMWAIGPKLLKDAGEKRADVCLGNRDYTSCSHLQTHFIKHFFESHGFAVAINVPYRGKFVLGFHCHRQKFPGIQIEFNRSLYLSEKTLSRKKGMTKHLNGLMEQLVEEISNRF
ncbi:MAG: N-formylglutamate amidohydrolase [Patescibacteria group bacterium]|nr:N-formylglutamate amidohydrolase [Patescibacteria group bacterium]